VACYVSNRIVGLVEQRSLMIYYSWTMGNLGRAGYGATVEGLVSFSFFKGLLSEEILEVAIYIRFM